MAMGYLSIDAPIASGVVTMWTLPSAMILDGRKASLTPARGRC
jgi:hypothetical protein